MENMCKYNREDLKKFENKLRLWCILHGVTVKEILARMPTFWMKNLCPRCPYSASYNTCTKGQDAKVLWMVRYSGEMIETSLKEATVGGMDCLCMEWVKHV